MGMISHYLRSNQRQPELTVVDLEVVGSAAVLAAMMMMTMTMAVAVLLAACYQTV
jgi:hypothetical protein